MKKDNGINIDRSIEELNEEIAKLEKEVSIKEKPKEKLKPPVYDKVKYQVKSKTKYYYLVPLANIFGSLLILALFFVFQIKLLYTLLYVIFVFPFFFLSGIFFFIRLYLDKNKISGFIIKRLSKNYIIANMFKENKRLVKIVRKLDKEGKGFNYKEGFYCIDMDAIWFDQDNRPNSLYLENIPNPLIFEFSKNIKTFISEVLSSTPKIATDSDGKLIDISFSATTLQLLKKDKIFKDLQRNPESEKLVMILVGVIVLMLIALVIIVLVVSK